MKYVITSIVIFLSALCWSQDTVAFTRLEKLDGKFYFLDKPYTGWTIKYYEGGEVSAKGFIKEGVKHGRHLGFYKGGSINKELNYEMGVANGYGKTYLENGILLDQSLYENHKIKEWVEYFQDTTNYPKLKVIYSDTIIVDSVFEMKSFTYYYNESGKVPFVQKTTINGQLWGMSSVYLNTAQFMVSIEYENGQRHGLWTTRFADKIDYQGYYSHGKLDGKWIYQDFYGEQVESVYKDGKLIEGKDLNDEIFIVFELQHFEER